jgi:hypothetical protein
VTPSDESYLRLKRSGWSICDITGWTPEGRYWLVWGSNGENLIRPRGGRGMKRGATPKCRRWDWA